jgi:three-Cys-motif partner protein
MSDHPSLWPDGQLPQALPKLPEKDFKPLRFPLWTQNKARLIREYLRLFDFITHHGTYIDGFAAPEDPSRPEMWAAKLVLEIEPKWFREFWLCDADPKGVSRLEALKAEHRGPKRRIKVLPGDFNESVSTILKSGTIGEKPATFALLDQRTFECESRTVVATEQT